MVEIHKDQGLAENPMDRIDETLMAKVFMKSLISVTLIGMNFPLENYGFE